jgi:hypothetical protein
VEDRGDSSTSQLGLEGWQPPAVQVQPVTQQLAQPQVQPAVSAMPLAETFPRIKEPPPFEGERQPPLTEG